RVGRQDRVPLAVRVPGRGRPVLLVGAHLQQHPRPRLPGVVEDGEHHLDVVADERARVGDGAVDVRRGGEVEDVVDGADLVGGGGGRSGGGGGAGGGWPGRAWPW